MEKGELFSYSWHIDEKEKNVTIIRIYGLNKKNENVCVIVKDFTPYVYIELPEILEWDNSKAQLVCNKIDELLHERKPLVKQLMFKKRLYYSSTDRKGRKKKFPYICCSFSHHDDIDFLRKKLFKPLRVVGIGAVKLKMHENNADPILQLTSVRKIPTAGWIQFVGKRVPEHDKYTTCDHEFTVRWKKLIPKDSDEVAKPLIMGYDLEANSTIPSAMPNAERPGDKIFQISCVFARQGAKEDTYESYLLTLGNPDQEQTGKKIHIRRYDTEHELLIGFKDIIQEKQPNIITGYNIFGFDIPYMIDRSQHNFCLNDFDRQGFDQYGHAKNRIIKWSSSAYKNQEFQFLDAEGRLFVDILPLVKRDYKMSNYKLKTISAHFLKGQTKDPLTPKGIFKCYRLGMQGGKKGRKALGIVGKYCVQDSVLVIKLFETLTTWVALCEMSKVTNVPIFSLYTRGQQLKVFSQVYKKCTHDNIVVENEGYVTKEDDHYMGATVFPPIPGVYDKVLPFDFSSLYPTTIIAYNISWDTLIPDDSTISDDKCHIMNWEDHVGCEHDPKEIRKAELNEIIKKYDAEIKSLREVRGKKTKKNAESYERVNLQIAEIKENTKPYREERSILQKSKSKHKMCCKRRFRWMKEPMGVLPEILTHLLDTRKATKKVMKETNKKLKGMDMSDEKYDITKTYSEVLDKRQLALKVSANSAYGAMGVRRGYLPLMPGAMCTTYKGRLAVQLAADSIQKDHGGKLIYGDTDSNYISFPHLKTAEECWDYSEKVSKEVTKLFPPPMNLEFEAKIYWRFLIITKKRYMSLSCERDGIIELNKDGTPKINKKGVLLQRRDNCNFIRTVYAKVIMDIFNKVDMEKVLYTVVEEINKLCSHFYPIKEFIITKSIGDVGDLEPYPAINDKGKECWKVGDYTIKKLPDNPKERDKKMSQEGATTEANYYESCLPAQVQLAQKMRRRGQLVAAGSRLEYVITTNGGHNAKQCKKIECAEYFAKHSSVLTLDYMYYLGQLAKPLDQILNIIYKDDDKFTKDFVLEQYKYRLKTRKKVLDDIRMITKPKIVFGN